MYTIFNETFHHAGKTTFPALQEDFEYAKMFMGITERLIREGKLKTHPEKIGGKGLEGALRGMQDLKDGRASGQKLVYRIQDTPKNSELQIEFKL